MDKKDETAVAAAATDTPAQGGDKPKKKKNKKNKEPKEELKEEVKDTKKEVATTDTKNPEGAADDAPKEKREPKQRRPKPESAKKEGKPEKETAPKKEVNGSTPQYRKKGEETPAENKDGEEKRDRKKQRKPKAQKDEEATADGQEEQKQSPTKYRVKGSAETEEGGEEKNTTEGGAEKKKKEDPPKNLIYQNPMEFKEKKKFKSKWDEYRYGEWRKGSGKTYVTLETVIPPKPEKEITAPDEAAFHKKQVDIGEKIKAINNKLDEMKVQFEEILAQKHAHRKGGENGEGAVVATPDLKVKFARMKELKQMRQKIYDAQDSAIAGQNDLIKERENAIKRIDKQYKQVELIPKAIKECRKKLEQTSGGWQTEQEIIKRIKFLEESVQFIQKKDEIDEIINKQFKKKKEAAKDLPGIIKEMKALSAEIDEVKKNQDVKVTNLEECDKQLNRISDKRKQMWDEKDKLRKEKDVLRDEYYGGLILYSKYKYLIQDIDWMTDMQSKIKAKNEERQKREQEKKERLERIQKEREEKKKQEEERRQREADRKQKALENKKLMEEQLVQTEVDGLAKLQAAIDDETVAANPLYDEIEQCQVLKKFIQKKLSTANEAAEETKDESTEKKTQKASEIDKLQSKGQLQKAPTKEEKLAANVFLSMKSNKGKKKKTSAGQAQESGVIDFSTIKKFNNLKITAPLTEDDFERAVKDLDELIEALLYWGNIIQRQNKIRFIRNSRKISSDKEYVEQAEEEEKFIEGEKAKFESDDTNDLSFSQEKLKIAQTLDREKRMKRAWNEEDDDDASEQDDDDDDRGYTAEDMGDEENPKAYTPKPQKGSRGRNAKTADGVTPENGHYKKSKKEGQRQKAVNFKAMNTQEAFPNMENSEDDEASDEEMGDMPKGEISQE